MFLLDNLKIFENSFEKSIEVKKTIVKNSKFDTLIDMGDIITESIISGNKVFFCGNGGSAADAQHLVAELLIRLRPNFSRKPIPAISLAQDTSTLTACGNDIDFDSIYSRVLSALGKPGDILVGITTSGNSINVVNAMVEAKVLGLKVFGFLGENKGKAFDKCDLVFSVPSDQTARIQECHITAGHALMEYVENELLRKGYFSE